MSEFRQRALDDSDRPLGLSPEAAFLAARQAAAAVLLQRDRELYPMLLQRYHDEGPSPELSELALEAAGDLATVLQSLRSRQDLIEALEQHPKVTAPPLVLFDQLQFSYLLLTDGATEEQREGLLTPRALAELLNSKRITDWLAATLG
jgi:hypothetical protein